MTRNKINFSLKNISKTGKQKGDSSQVYWRVMYIII